MRRERSANRVVGRSRRSRKSRNAEHRAEPQHTEPYLWIAAGAVTLGVGAALASGSGLAYADTSHAGGSTPSAGGNSHSNGSAASAGSSGGTRAATSSMQGSTSTGSNAATSGNTGSSASQPFPKTALPASIPTNSRTSGATTNSGTITATTGATTNNAGTVLPTSSGSTHPATGHQATTPTPGTATAGSTWFTGATRTDPAPSAQAMTPGAVKLQATAPSTATQKSTLVATATVANVPAMVSPPAITTPATPPATTGIVAKLLAQFLGAVGATSLLDNTGPGSPPPPSIVAGALALIERGLQRVLFNGAPTASPVQTSDSLVTGLIDHLIGVLSLGALHPNAASSVVQAVVPATVVPTAQASAAGSGTVPLQMINGTEPVIDISVNGGPSEPVLVDTGSDGLVIGLQDIGLQNLATLGFPTGFGFSGYSGGLYYVYATFNTTVNFGNGIVTAPTSVDVPILTIPESLDAFLAPDGAVGVLGIGPNAVGPGPSSVISALPGDLNEGVLINESQGVLEFGPNPLTTRVSVAGAPNASLMVQVGNGPLESVPAVIDSGGVYGTIPSSVIGNSQLSGNLPAGTLISVYTSDGQTLLYSYTTTATNSPTVTSGSGDAMNTGYEPFAQQPVYISYSPSGLGTTSFDYV